MSQPSFICRSAYAVSHLKVLKMLLSPAKTGASGATNSAHPALAKDITLDLLNRNLYTHLGNAIRSIVSPSPYQYISTKTTITTAYRSIFLIGSPPTPHITCNVTIIDIRPNVSFLPKMCHPSLHPYPHHTPQPPSQSISDRVIVPSSTIIA
jgi:hypothetical protein